MSNITASPGANSAVITWSSAVPATGQVQYGTTTSYGSASPGDGTLVSNHSVTLTG